MKPTQEIAFVTILVRLGLFIMVLLCLGGCGDTEIDASSDERLKESIEDVKSSLTAKEREEFEDAILTVTLADADLLAAASDPDSMKRKMKDRLDGKTPQQIIAEANRMKVDRREKQRQQVLSEIAELETARRQAAEAEEGLRDFLVERSRFYRRESDYLQELVIEVTVRNETEHAVSRAYFHGVLATPGRSVPWVAEDFNYNISGGLEPGEAATWKLAPNMFGAWSKAPEDRDDMVLTVTVTRIDGADDEPIFNAEFAERDQERLQRLKDKLVELEANDS